MANRVGLSVPCFTRNSFQNPAEETFKKNLGFPFVVSLNRKKGFEVGVTTTNVTAKGRIGRTLSPWQWQELIRSKEHVRCCVVGGRVWSVSSDYPANADYAQDFRFLNQIREKEIEWKPYELPKMLALRLVELNKHLGISVSCPELLVRKKGGEPVLIDLNPCGDWWGFFTEDSNDSIASALADAMTSND
jgi:hypothetical protein